MQIVDRAEVELAAVDNLITGSNTVIELLVGISRLILVDRLSRIDSPVDIEFCKKGIRHPLGRLAVGVLCDILCKIRDNLCELTLNPLSHFLSWRTRNDNTFSRNTLKDRCITEAVHQDPCEIGTHGTGWCGHLCRSATTQFLKDGICFSDTRCHF